MRSGRMGAVALCMATLAMAVTAGPASAEIVFDGSPGTDAPPPTLGGHEMTPYTDDPRSPSSVTSIPDFPGGELGFSRTLRLSTIGSGWGSWSHGYKGDVYAASSGTSLTMTLPAGTGAFYFYGEPNRFSSFTMEAVSDDGTTSGPVSVHGSAGAKYFGFYATDADETIASVELTVQATANGFAVGEFGWARARTCAEATNGSGEQGPVSGIVHGADATLGETGGLGSSVHELNCDVVAGTLGL